MAAPSKSKPTSKSKGYTPKVNKSTGFTTGVQKVKKANKAAAKAPVRAARGTNTYSRKAPGKDPMSLGVIGDVIGLAGAQAKRIAEGKKGTSITNALRNKDAVFPYVKRKIKGR